MRTDNERQILLHFSHKVACKLFAEGVPIDSFQHSSVEVNDFSICFRLKTRSVEGNEEFYVKIPKADLYKKSVKRIIPLTEADRDLARNEYSSLCFLSQIELPLGCKVWFVTPFAFLEDCNAIVTRKVKGTDLLNIFRWAVISEEVGFKQFSNRVGDFLYRIGQMVSLYHQEFLKKSEFTSQPFAEKIGMYFQRLKNVGVDSAFLDYVKGKLDKIGTLRTPASVTKTLKGLDVRNIIVKKTGEMVVLDPGKLKEDYCAADLARFIVTCRILFWGSLWFFFREEPGWRYEKQFLGGYYKRQKREDKRIFSFFVVKELLKHWHLAHMALHLKPWPSVLKCFLKYTYIDPFYKNQITDEITNLVG